MSAFVTSNTFSTKEQAHARDTGSLQEYWRLHDPMCSAFLKSGRDPRHFIPMKAFFPFVRDASVLQMPKTTALLSTWLGLAFHAGFLFGTHRAAAAEDILEHNGVEKAAALGRLKILSDELGQSPATPVNLFSAFENISQRQWKSPEPEALHEVFVYAPFNAFKAGMAAPIFGKTDPALLGLVETTQSPVDATYMPLSWRSLILSPYQAHGRPVWESLAHPLLKLAAAYYPRATIQRETMLSFFVERLSSGELISENAAENDVESWVRRGLEFGIRIKAERPQQLTDILAELGEGEVEGVRKLVQSVITNAAGTDFTKAIVEWNKKTNEWHGLGYYGQQLDRIVYCSDFAIWVPWVTL